MEKLIIKTALKQYAAMNPKRYHMPGHKADKDFIKNFPQAAEDITELSFSDSLSCPTGIIKDAENFVTELLGAKRSFFLTDGSTCGIYSMLYAVREFGGKIAVNRNSHQSVFNACKLIGIEPIILHQNVKSGIMLPPTVDEMEQNIQDEDCIGLLLTYPGYYGLTCDIKKARELCDKYNKLLLVDGAHGAHLKFDNLPPYCGDYADLWVDGVHKTLPCLTQAAVLNVGNKTLIAKTAAAVNMFRTTSPSYPIMASIEYGERFMMKFGKELLSKLRVEILAMRARLNAKGYKTVNSDDVFKLCVDFKSVNISPYVAEDYLKKHKVFCEMNDGRYLMFLFGVKTSMRALVSLEKLLYRILRKKEFKDTYEPRKRVSMGIYRMPYLQASLNSRKESVELKASAGRILAENVGVLPPCFPLCVAGEEMTEEIIETLVKAKNTFGVNNGRVKVIK